jgi:hypothetical protein
MPLQTKFSRRILVLALPALLAVGCDDHNVVAPRNQSDLLTNRTKWEYKGSDSYAYEFNWVCFCPREYVAPVLITVEDGGITHVLDVEKQVPLDPEAFARYKTIDELFDFLEEAIQGNADDVGATYNEALGYPESCYIDYDRGTADEEMGFSVHEVVLPRSKDD